MSSLAHTSTSLAALAAALGGETYAGGRSALVPAPGHSAQDRSVSLRLVDGRLLVHCFGGADWREVLDDLRNRGLIDADNRLTGAAPGGRSGQPPAPEPSRAERIAAAAGLWAEGAEVTPGDPAGRYLARRGVAEVGAGVASLRAHGAAPAGVYRRRGPYRPALLAGVQDRVGALTAVEVTYLDNLGRRSRLARPPRKLVGALPPGSAVRLAPPAEAMLVGEGVFTTLSAMRRFDLPGWALLSTSNLRRWTPPAGVRRVLIAGDRGADGERSAGILQAVLRATGVVAEVALPPAGYGDWNDPDQEEVRRKGG